MVEELVRKVVKETKETDKQPQEQGEQHMTISELCEFLKCKPNAIHSYKRLGMPFYKVGRKVLFKKDEVLTYMKAGTFLKRKVKKE